MDSFTGSQEPSPERAVEPLTGIYWMLATGGFFGAEDSVFQKRVIGPTNNVLSGENYLSGVLLSVPWKEINPRKGIYEWDRLDEVIKLLAEYETNYKFALVPGTGSPSWIYQEGCRKFTFRGRNRYRKTYGTELAVPLPWDTLYHKYYFDCLEKVAARYGRDPLLKAVTACVANTEGGEMHLPNSRTDREKWGSYDGFEERIRASIEMAIQRTVELFPGKVVSISLGSLTCGMAPDAWHGIIEKALEEHRDCFGVIMHQLNGRMDMQLSNRLYRVITAYKTELRHIGMQTLAGWQYEVPRKRQGSMQMTAYNYVFSKATHLEVWNGDGRNNATLEELLAEIERVRQMTPERYKEQLMKNGEYVKFRPVPDARQ